MVQSSPSLLSAAVGVGQPNRVSDVRQVQQLLRQNGCLSCFAMTPALDGRADADLTLAIRQFQRKTIGMAIDTGIVAPGDITWQRLSSGRLRLFAAPVSWDYQAKDPRPPTMAQFGDVAKALDCSVAAVRAVAAKECPGGQPFFQGRPMILFEPRQFRKFTGHKFDRSNPGVSADADASGKWSHQYVRLEQAAALAWDEAHRATSWGQFQIMGNAYAAAGFDSVAAMVTAMCDSVVDHMFAFTNFIRSNPVLQTALRKHDWTTFAHHYNGAGYRKNHYDTDLKKLFEQFSSPEAPSTPAAAPRS